MKFDIKRLLNTNELKKLFESYSLTSGFDVALYDREGNECFSVRKKECVCNYININNYCKNVISESGMQAAKLKEPYIYETACGLVMCITPIIIEKEVMGFISSGPMILWDNDEDFKTEFKSKCRKINVDVTDETLKSIKKIDCNVMTGSAKMLGILVNYMVSETKKYLSRKDVLDKMNLERYRAQKELEIFERQKEYKKYPIEREKELLAYVQLGEKRKAREIINVFLNEIFSYASGDLGIIKAKLYEFTAFLSRTAVEAGAPIDSLKDIVSKSSNFFLGNLDFSDLCYITIEIMEEFIDVVYESRSGISVHLAKAIEYINSHYYEKIDLGTVAKSIFVSNYYLSHLFRDGINMTFSDYLNKVRTDKAKILLLEGAKSEEVAEKVGYSDLNYFNKTFKKYVGISPSKYRKAAMHTD